MGSPLPLPFPHSYHVGEQCGADVRHHLAAHETAGLGQGNAGGRVLKREGGRMKVTREKKRHKRLLAFVRTRLGPEGGETITLHQHDLSIPPQPHPVRTPTPPLTMSGQMSMRMMSAGRSPSVVSPADEVVRRRLSGGT